MSTSKSTDFSKSGLNSTSINDLKDGDDYCDESFILGIKAISGYKPNNTGYLKSYMNILGIEKLVGQEVTRKEGNDYYLYSKVMEEKTKELVDDQYAKNTYANITMLDDDSSYGDSLSYDSLTNSIYDIVNTINDSENFDTFSLAATEISKDSITSSKDDNMYGELLGDIDTNSLTASATVDITLTDGIYELKTVMLIDDLATTIYDQPTLIDIESSISIKFDKNSIKDISMAVNYDQETTEKCSSVLDEEDYNVTFNDNNTLTTNTKLSTTSSISIDSFSDSLVNQTLTGYQGTGENNEVEKRMSNITFECANCPNLSLEDSYSAQFGSNMLTLFESAQDDLYIDLSDFDGIKLYWDKECQQEVTATDTIPSYDTTLYFKINVPASQAYAYITIETVDFWTSYDYEDRFYNSGDTLTFSDFNSSSATVITKVVVNGEIITEPSITLEGNKIYDIVITLEYNN